ncbi:MAG TPA: hypothetical protein VGN16_09440 [Acidobacteriaceae bacterium]
MIEKTSKTLMNNLDAAASALLKRHFPDQVPEGMPESDPEIQIKAFSAVVNYYGPRTKLGGKEEENKRSDFDRLKGQLHGSGKARRRAGAPESGANGASSAAVEPAGNA